MGKYLGYVSVIVTILTLIIGGVSKFNFIEAKVEKSSEKIVEVEKKISDLDKENDVLKDENSKMDKSLGEFSVEQKFISKQVDEVNEGLKELIKEIKRKK